MAKQEQSSTIEDKVLQETLHKMAVKFKQLRIDKGFSSYEDYAWAHGFSRMQVWKMEQGNNLTMKSLLRILKTHDMSLAEFFKDFDTVVK